MKKTILILTYMIANILISKEMIQLDFKEYEIINKAVLDFEKTMIFPKGIEIKLDEINEFYVVTFIFPQTQNFVDKKSGFYAMSKDEGVLNIELVYTFNKSNMKIINKEYYNRN